MSDALEIEMIPLKDVRLDPKNARSHSERNLEAIMESLRQFGQRKPIVVTHDGMVVAGNGTVEAAQNLGWTQISATRIPDDWSRQQITAYAIADNRTAELASWDSEILVPALAELEAAGMLEWTGFTQYELQNWDSLALRGGLPGGDSRLDNDEEIDPDEEQGSLLALADVTVAEPKHEVAQHDIFMLTMPKHDVTHVLIVANVMKEWTLWADYLQGEAIFVPFPDPFITGTDVARKQPLVLVQPDYYMAGHVLDKHAAFYGEEHVTRMP
jgi:hypothetical protein